MFFIVFQEIITSTVTEAPESDTQETIEVSESTSRRSTGEVLGVYCRFPVKLFDWRQLDCSLHKTYFCLLKY